MENIKYKKKSHLLALAIAAISIVWVGSGLFSPPKAPDILPVKQDNSFNVTTEISYTEEHAKTLNFYGHSKASQKLIIRSEIKGKVSQILKQEGDIVKRGNTLIVLDTRQYFAAYKQASANYESKRISYNSIKNLYKQGLASKTQLTNSNAEYQAAEAELKVAKINLDNTKITAPFDGRIENIAIEIGEVIDSYKEEIATIINDEEIYVESFIPEKLISDITSPENIKIKFVNNIEKTGTLNYIASSSDSETKTYKIELLVDNANKDIKDGMTAEVMFVIAKMPAHKIKTSALSLDSDGNIGLKTIQPGNLVKFKQANIISEEGDYAWLSGLPTIIEFISVGHGFVEDNEIVKPHRKEFN